MKKTVALLAASIGLACLSGCFGPSMNTPSQSVGSLPKDASTSYVKAPDAATAQAQTVTQYVPVPVPGQLMPVPNRSNMAPNATQTGEGAVQAANKEATQVPSSQQFFNAMMSYDYMPGAMYTVYCAPLAITDIALQPGEKLISEAAGDTLRWQVSQTYSGSGGNVQQHLLVKPTSSGLSNTLIITTDQRVYHLVLQSTDDNTYMMQVSWNYPNNFVQFSQGAQNPNTATGASVSGGSPFQIDLANLDFNYEFGMVTGNKPAWYPVRVFNDGRQTFIEFPENFYTTDLPVLYVPDNNGNYGTMTNWRLKGRFMIIDTVLNKAQLQTGIAKFGQTIVQIQETDGNS